MSKYYNEFWNKYKNQHLEDFVFKWPVLKKILPLKNGDAVLDFGCGTGRIMKKMKELSPKSKFTGVDVSETAINIAKKKHIWANFYSVQDGDKFPFKKNSFDLILAADVIEHVYNTKHTLSELHRVLKRDGKIIVTTPYYGFIKNLLIIALDFDNIFDPAGPHIRFFSKKSLFSLLGSIGLKIIQHGYFGRFYPISRSIYVIAEKKASET